MKKTILMLAAATLLAAACQTEPQPVVNDPAEVVMTNILNRKSVRSYTGDTIPVKVMENLLRAAMAAPSGRNIQPWSFVVLNDTSRYDEIFGENFNMGMYKQSAAVVVVCADTTVVRPRATILMHRQCSNPTAFGAMIWVLLPRTCCWQWRLMA